MGWLPIADWLPRYQRSWLTPDLIAGVTVWALVVPQAIAYAQIAGLPPQAGIFASFAAPLGYALFGTSRQLIVSPTSATAAISASLVAPLIVADDAGEYAALSAVLAILSGVLFLLLGRFQMGFLAQFIAFGVQTGFLMGLGLTIMVGQLFKVLGTSSIDGPFYEQAWHLATHLGETNGWTLVIGGGSLAVLLAFRVLAPGVPSALLVVALSIVIVAILDLEEKGVAVVGTVDRAIPLPSIPIVDLADVLVLIPGTLAIVVIGYSESMSVARQFADEHHYDVRPNQELVALGAASIFGGVFQGFITAGGASQSAANDRAGARTQVSSLVLAGLAFLSAVALMPFFRDLPLAVLGAIVINAVIGFVDIAAMRRIASLRFDSMVISAIAFVGVLVLGILPGLLIAAVLSILYLLNLLSRPQGHQLARIRGSRAYGAIDLRDDTDPEPGLFIFRQDMPLLFVNADWMRDSIKQLLDQESGTPEVVVLDLDASPDLDISGMDALRSIHRDFAARGIRVWLAGIHQPVRDIMERGGISSVFGAERLYATIEDAVEAYRSERDVRRRLPED